MFPMRMRGNNRSREWAGKIDMESLPDSDILHIAPVAGEISIDRLSGEYRSGWSA